ncbi:MAG: DUF3035 domain-containing protein [Pseudomonadota bacterium]
MVRDVSLARRLLLLACVAVLAAGCGRGDGPRLLNLEANNDGPDEFAILPTKPLETPPDTSLPTPTPGGVNRTDPTPQADAMIALGGRPAPIGVTAAEAALVNYARRMGADPGIRQELAREDLEFRRDNNGRLLERAFNVNTYFDAYEDLALDQRSELERFRAAGVRTPAVPPDGAE